MKKFNINIKPTAIVITLLLGLLICGCEQNAVQVNLNDSLYNTSMHLILQPDFADRSFSSSNDYSVSTQFNEITYIWPVGKGNFSSKLKEISFEGNNISCSVVERRLTINGRQIAEFEQGDRVRITPEGKIFVNDVELKTPSNI